MGRKQRNILILLVALAAFWVQRQLLSPEGTKAVVQADCPNKV